MSVDISWLKNFLLTIVLAGINLLAGDWGRGGAGLSQTNKKTKTACKPNPAHQFLNGL